MKLIEIPFIHWLLIALLVSSCTSFKSFPRAVAPGETITLAVGTPDNLTRATLQSVEFHYRDQNGNDTGAVTDLTNNVRAVFSLYADKKSALYDPSSTGVAAYYLISDSLHEPWLTVIALDIPTDMAPGSGWLKFQTVTGTGGAIYPANTRTLDEWLDPDVNDPADNNQAIAVEILDVPATTPNNFAYEVTRGNAFTGNLSVLEPEQYALVAPKARGFPGPFEVSYGAIEMKLGISTAASIGSLDYRIVDDDITVLSRSNRTVLHSISSDGTTMTVMYISPLGYLGYYEPRFSIVLNDGNTFNAPPVIESIKCFSVDGATTLNCPDNSNPADLDFTVAMR